MGNKIDKWIHLEDEYQPWVLPIWSVVNDAIKENKISPLSDEIYKQAICISTRLNILPRIIKRINDEVSYLFELVKTQKKECNIFTITTEGCVLRNNYDSYNIICDIDSFFFEFNSACELISKLLESLYSHAGKPLRKNGGGLKIKSLIENSKQNSSWFIELDNHRNLFAHNATPYIAIDITNESKYDILIMKENLKIFDDEEKFIRFSDLQKIISGFIYSKDAIQEDLINLFRLL